MSWNDYHLNTVVFCDPLIVMSGLVSALSERQEVLDSEFHASCTTSGTSAVIENRLTHILGGKWYDDVDPGKIPFRTIRKEYAYDEVWGFSRNLTFMHMFDASLFRLLKGFSRPGGNGLRRFTDSTGNTVYGSLENLASALSEDLIVPSTIPVESTSATIAVDGIFQVCLNAAWAAQRVRMMKLLRHVSVYNGGFIMRYAYSPSILHSYGESPQNAYDMIPFWTHDEFRFIGGETPLECRLEYRHVGFNDPEEQWFIHSATELEQIVPDHQGCPAITTGILRFDAVNPQERDEDGIPLEDGNCSCPFDPLDMPISSGENTLVLSNGVFASRQYGTASGIGGTDTAPGQYIRGWQAQNVKVIYDYESYFNFKQEE